MLNTGVSLQVRISTLLSTSYTQCVQLVNDTVLRNVQVPIGARFIGIPGTESAESPRGIMVQVYWQQDDSGSLCISGYSQEMPIPSHVELQTGSSTSHMNTSRRRKKIHGIVIDPSQITESDLRS